MANYGTTNFDGNTQLLEMENISSITFHEVLQFWFGGDTNVNYKTKWFPSGNEVLQQAIDHEITSKYGELLQRAVNGDLEEWTSTTKSCVALIIVLDQFSRHIYRNLSPDAFQRKIADNKALTVATALTTQENWDDSLHCCEFVFCLMPFRHAATTDHLTKVMDFINSREHKENEGMNLLQKFKKQTIRRLQHLQDRAMV